MEMKENSKHVVVVYDENCLILGEERKQFYVFKKMAVSEFELFKRTLAKTKRHELLKWGDYPLIHFDFLLVFAFWLPFT